MYTETQGQVMNHRSESLDEMLAAKVAEAKISNDNQTSSTEEETCIGRDQPNDTMAPEH